VSIGRQHWIDLSVQSVMIVFSVLLALAASSWADARKQQRLGDQALLSFAQEIRANRARVAKTLPYHDSLDVSAKRADSVGRVHTYADWKRSFPAWSGFAPPDLTTAAWQSALATGALGNIRYDRVAALANVYTIQNKLDAFNASYIPLFDFSDAVMPSTIRRMRAYSATVLSFERAMLASYDETLELIDSRRAVK
jgi:type II secretory pathway pseudopilin PulG